jgi:hypothetical protein
MRLGARHDGQALLLLVAAMAAAVVGAVLLGGVAQGIGKGGREQRAADLGALAAARTMHDAYDRLFEPPTLDDGRANPRHLEVGAYERMGREAALGVARANGAAANCKTHRSAGSVRVTTTLVARGPAAAIVLDDEQVATIGEGAKRFPVRATVNGYSWRTTVTPMHGETLLGLNRAIRESAGAQAGDTVEVAIELDTAAREVDIPEALARALAGDPAANAAFEALAFTHRKEYARWVGDAKRQETRERRVTQALEMLREGKTLR